MNFHETKRGAIFFEYQLPELTNALNRVADAICSKVTKVKNDGRLLTKDNKEALISIKNCDRKSEKLGELVCSQIQRDYKEVGSNVAKAIENGSINDLLLSLCGFTIAGLIEEVNSVKCGNCEGGANNENL